MHMIRSHDGIYHYWQLGNRSMTCEEGKRANSLTESVGDSHGGRLFWTQKATTDRETSHYI